MEIKAAKHSLLSLIASSQCALISSSLAAPFGVAVLLMRLLRIMGFDEGAITSQSHALAAPFDVAAEESEQPNDGLEEIF